jgi:hypothetical protein
LIVWYAFARDAHAANRMFPSRPLSLSAPVGLTYWGHAMIMAAYVAISIYLPLVLTVLHGVAPLYVGLANGVMSIAWSISSASVAGLHGSSERKVVVAGPLFLMSGSIGLAMTAIFGGQLGWVIACVPLVGIGIGIFHVHMTARTMGAARPGEESITASSLSTIRALGMAFGAALAGTIANVAGLQELATADAVRSAVTWVYLFNILPLAMALTVTVLFFRIADPDQDRDA